MNNKWIISRDYMFSAAHRLEGHPKCGRLHGHNYEVTVMLEDEFLAAESWLMDYAQLDAIVKPIVEELDHYYIVSKENTLAGDPYASLAVDRDEAVVLQIERSTAECISKWLAEQVSGALKLLDRETICVSVIIYETPKSSCTYAM